MSSDCPSMHRVLVIGDDAKLQYGRDYKKLFGEDPP